MKLNVLILTYNEAPNIKRTLSNLTWAENVLIVDSFSKDETVKIARKFQNVTVLQREFDDHTSQWEFGRKILEPNADWILALDADYQVTPEAREDICQKAEESSADAHFVHFKYAIHGKVIESGVYNPVAVLYRPDRCRYVKDGHTQRLSVKGVTVGEPIQGYFIHDDRKPFRHWLQSQERYAELEAQKLRQKEREKLARQDRIRLTSKWTPLLMFGYCIFVRGGWKEGPPGWIYGFQRMLAEVILQIKLLEQKID